MNKALDSFAYGIATGACVVLLLQYAADIWTGGAGIAAVAVLIAVCLLNVFAAVRLTQIWWRG